MSDEPPGLNSPRRKARFRSQYDDDVYRRRPPAKIPGAEAVPEPAVPVDELTPATDALAAMEPAATPPPPAEETDDLLPNFRLNKVYEPPPPPPGALKDWRWLLVTASLLALGLAGGYWFGLTHPATVSSGAKREGKPVVAALTSEVQAQVDAAFAATKKGQYQQASDAFIALRKAHPDWWSMGIESARASLYLHDPQGTQRALKDVNNPEGLPDVDFITALLHLTNKELELAEASFAAAVARDPTRPDFYYFWGECLRRDGKPLEAVEKFRSALLRNQYENAEGLYQVKLWLSQIQAGAEDATGASKEIDAALATARPPYEAFFAAAAREMKAKRYPEAVNFIARALAITEPAVFRVIMQDPTFIEEANVHGEFAPFYR